MSAPITTTLNLTTAAAPTAAQKAVADPTAALTQAMQKAEVKCEAKDEESALPIQTFTGLDPNDEKGEVIVTGTIYQSVKRFEELGLSEALLKGCYDMKFTRPSKIQGQALPVIMSAAHTNLIGQAHHGSGKTATYSLGMLSRVDETKMHPQCICVTPTRELARQVFDVVNGLAKFTKIKSFLAVPGGKREKVTAQVVIGTPGTLLNKFDKKNIDPRGIVQFVADEADVMISKQGLGEQTLRLRKKLSRNGVQVLLFSATYPERVRKFATKVAPNATKIVVKKEALTLDNIAQFYMDCETAQGKYPVLSDLYGLMEVGQSIIFVHTVATAKKLAGQMRKDGYTVSLLHGRDMEHSERDRVMDDFRTGKTTVLITTNVLARGIDVLQVTLVINYDLPLTRNNKPDPETYIHRIGRVGRFGRKGVAINFVHDLKSKQDLSYIAQYFNASVEELPIDDLEEVENAIHKGLGLKKK